MKVATAFLGLVAAVTSGNPDYEARQLEIRDLTIELGGVHKQSVQSCSDQDVDLGALSQRLADLDQDRDAAFDIIILIRILFCGSLPLDSATENSILTALAPIPFWLEAGEDTRVYWTENQLIMWMSSEYLLQQQYPDLKEYSSTLRQRLLHYLNMKMEYGFVEFFSSVYFPYTLAGLLNLVDFCTDPEIQSLAVQVANELLRLILLVSNEQGEFLAAAGRNSMDYYIGEPAILGVIWMLLGAGSKPTYTHHVTSFLSTSKLNVDSVINSYPTTFDGSVYAGPSLYESNSFNSELSRIDRTVFQWSAGAYFHPETIDDTQFVLETLDLEGHGENDVVVFVRFPVELDLVAHVRRDTLLGEFGDFSAFVSLPPWLASYGSQLLASVSKSSLIAGFHVEIFRDGPSVLTSARNFWPGRMGFESWPWIATTGKLPVWTQSGQVKANWLERPRSPSNTHLPRVVQESNVALIMYNRNNDLSLLGGALDFEVALYWPQQGFAEELDIGLWKIGREGNGYIAVARHCTDTVDNIPTCTVEHQTWAVVVGNSDMYGSFDNFVAKVEEATYDHSYRWVWSRFRNVFKGKVQFDGTSIEYEWS